MTMTLICISCQSNHQCTLFTFFLNFFYWLLSEIGHYHRLQLALVKQERSGTVLVEWSTVSECGRRYGVKYFRDSLQHQQLKVELDAISGEKKSL